MTNSNLLPQAGQQQSRGISYCKRPYRQRYARHHWTACMLSDSKMSSSLQKSFHARSLQEWLCLPFALTPQSQLGGSMAVTVPSDSTSSSEQTAECCTTTNFKTWKFIEMKWSQKTGNAIPYISMPHLKPLRHRNQDDGGFTRCGVDRTVQTLFEMPCLSSIHDAAFLPRVWSHEPEMVSLIYQHLCASAPAWGVKDFKL